MKVNFYGLKKSNKLILDTGLKKDETSGVSYFVKKPSLTKENSTEKVKFWVLEVESSTELMGIISSSKINTGTPLYGELSILNVSFDFPTKTINIDTDYKMVEEKEDSKDIREEYAHLMDLYKMATTKNHKESCSAELKEDSDMNSSVTRNEQTTVDKTEIDLGELLDRLFGYGGYR